MLLQVPCEYSVDSILRLLRDRIVEADFADP